MSTQPDPATTAPAGTAADDDSAFDAAFAEFAGEADSTPDPPAAGDAAPDAGLQGNENSHNHEQKDIDSSADAAVPSNPTTAAPAARPTEGEAARARIAELEHQRRSDQGRLWVLQRRLQEHERQAASAQPGAAHKTQGRQTGGTDDTSASQQSHPTEDGQLAALMETFPEVGRPVAQILDSLRHQNAALSARLSEMDAREVNVLLDRNESVLAEAHPDWQQVTGSPAFLSWLSAQPAYVQQAAQRNGERIVDPAESGDIIGRFKTAFAAPQPPASDAAQAPQTPAPPATTAGASATLAARRARQLDAGQSVPSRAPGGASGPPDDFDAAFAFYAGRK